jgi:hypothetical protein
VVALATKAQVQTDKYHLLIAPPPWLSPTKNIKTKGVNETERWLLLRTYYRKFAVVTFCFL